VPIADIAGLFDHLVGKRKERRRHAELQRTHGIGFALSNDGIDGGAWQCSAGLDLSIAAKLLAELQQLSRSSAWHRLS
jgi:hypothetical protein